MARGLTAEGVEALDQALARHVERGDLPGLVALVARDDDVHVVAIGHKAFGDAESIRRDAIFRIASISKPVAGVAAMLLIQDGAMALDDPVRRWLPELAEPRVLRALESSLDDTVPAERPITVEDVLSFHLLPADRTAGCACSTRRTAGTRRRRSCPTPAAGWCPRPMICGRSPRCWPRTAAGCA
jgi:hypothetical protein